MQAVLALEFDANYFLDAKACLDWLERSEYDYVLNLRGFRLKRLRLERDSLSPIPLERQESGLGV